jgi:hypothetical protein
VTYHDALRRALAHLVVGATSTPLASAVLDVSAWKLAAAAGLGAVVNFAGRAAQTYLDDRRS